MHGGKAFLAVFVVVLLLNVPTFVFGFLATKCGLYLVPRIKRWALIRWVGPFVVAFLLMLFGVGITIVHLERPWPTSPFLSGWGCLGLICIADLGLFFLWPWLKYREHRKRASVVAAQADAVRPCRDG
jgi:hypothetical protein